MNQIQGNRGAAVTATDRYDAIIIGSGQAGTPLSKTLAQAGRKTALVEREHVGGTCVNVGCTPTKTMVASARVAYLARRAADYGVQAGPVTVDMAKVRERKRKIVDNFRSGSQRSIERTKGLDLLLGEARFTGPKSIEVRLNGDQTRSLTADLIFINTGDRPARPSVPGLDRVPTLDSTSIMELDELPQHLLVVGGGYIGLEFSQMFRRFGSRVTIVQRHKHVLPWEDVDLAEEIETILRQDGVEVLLEAEPQRAARSAGGTIELTVRLAGEGEPRAFTGSHLLVAAGRVPNTDRLDLAAAGVRADEQGYVQVNERLETNVPGIYALGDVKGGPAFTHISYDDFRIIETNLLKGGNATTRDRLVPYTVYIDPELGRVGLSETEARRRGGAVQVFKMPMGHVARALEMDEPRGVLKVVVDAETSQILGCAMLGIAGGELMSMVEIAMMAHLPYTALRDGIFAHPTLAEALNNLFDQ
jgi:pyruvate/2-oxoglutarate dehydrogenase complex dihydrolipoamide dehydrogenase (E3) component